MSTATRTKFEELRTKDNKQTKICEELRSKGNNIKNKCGRTKSKANNNKIAKNQELRATKNNN